MKELLIYALEVLVCSAALLLAYSVLLERRTAFLHCRLYLIGAMLLAALIPALSIPVWTFPPQTPAVWSSCGPLP